MKVNELKEMSFNEILEKIIELETELKKTIKISTVIEKQYNILADEHDFFMDRF